MCGEGKGSFKDRAKSERLLANVRLRYNACEVLLCGLGSPGSSCPVQRNEITGPNSSMRGPDSGVLACQ